MSTAPYLPQGTVYGVLLNFRGEFDAAQPLMAAPPYKGAPQAPVLYIKPANTFSAAGTAIALTVPQAEIGASIGMVIGASGVAGWVLLNDLSIPHSVLDQGYYRPPVKYKCLDGFLGVGADVVPLAAQPDASVFRLQVWVNGALSQTLDFSQLRRDADTLLNDVREFMDLRPGDVLMLGCDALPEGGRPLAHAGDHIELRCAGFAPLINTLRTEVTA